MKRVAVTVVAALIAGSLGVVPSTVCAAVSFCCDCHGWHWHPWRLWDALLAPAGLLVAQNAWIGTRILTAAVVHSGMALFWAGVLCALLPRRRPVIHGIGMGFSIAVLDLLVIGQAFPIQRMFLKPPLDQFWPWLADHLVFGALVGAVVGYRCRQDATDGGSGSADRVGVGWARPTGCVPVDGQPRARLPRLAVGVSFAVSFAGFVISGAVVDFSLALGVMLAVFSPAVFLLPPALLGTVLSIRNPSRIGWLFCAHACLLAFYVMAFSVGKRGLCLV